MSRISIVYTGVFVRKWVWVLVDLWTLVTHQEDDSSDVTYFYCVYLYVCEEMGLGTS